jgi:hypothetical protein
MFLEDMYIERLSRHLAPLEESLLRISKNLING